MNNQKLGFYFDANQNPVTVFENSPGILIVKKDTYTEVQVETNEFDEDGEEVVESYVLNTLH